MTRLPLLLRTLAITALLVLTCIAAAAGLLWLEFYAATLFLP